ncbi:threonyl-tRNA synthetase, partial [Lecanoromycetidae sp. Uapishka_2]
MESPLPDFIVKRNELFDKLKSERQAEILGKEKPQIDVVLELGLDKNGKPRPAMPVAAKAWESTPGSFLKHVDKDVSSDVVVAEVDGKELWDLDRPLEMADFGVLHRNEASGALNGMTRVRKFQQDDAHIFCTQDQIKEEIEGLFDFLRSIYGLFGFPFKLLLSTRPEKYLGDLETWDRAESKLKEALDKFTASGGGQWELNEGDGAFYGPKIDIELSDALNRGFQCATIQLDFQLPQKFELEFMTADTNPKAKVSESSDTKPDSPDALASKPKAPGPGRARPVMIHRAIIGSFERFMAVITEHFAGKWPFWLSPRQVLVIPVVPAFNQYAEEVQKLLKDQKMNVDMDISGNTMAKKIRTGQMQQYNFIFVVGAEEQESRSVNIRNRDDHDTQSKGEQIPLAGAIAKLKALKKERRLINSI